MSDSPVISFDSDDPQFTRGVEFGIIWQTISFLPPQVTKYESLVHTSNLEMLLRLCDQLNWSMRVEDVRDRKNEAYDEWSLVTLEREEPTIIHNPDINEDTD